MFHWEGFYTELVFGFISNIYIVFKIKVDCKDNKKKITMLKCNSSLFFRKSYKKA